MNPWILAISALCLALSGCATTSAPTQPLPADTEVGMTPPADLPDSSPTVETAPPRASADAATLALLNQSERALNNGSVEEALAYTERAVRIDPHSAELWTRLAQLELIAGDPDTAIQFANKALSLAPDRPDRQRDAWMVIADATDALGDPDAARLIREKWRVFRG